jgi:CSLREA domain-containing protein
MLLAAAIALACVLVWPAMAAAESFVVTTAADEADATLGDFTCLTAGGKCSLRAALEEANFSEGEFDEVSFEEEVFEGDSASTIELGSALPPIGDPLALRGRECETDAGVFGPCVEIDAVASAPGLTIEETEEVEIEGIAIIGAEVGVVAEESPRLRLRSSWFGVALDGSAAGNGAGIEIGPGSNGTRIGGEGSEAGNLVANSTGIGLDILGVSNVRVLGNEFGVAPSGTQAAPNGTDIAISSTAGADAIGNSVGTRVSTVATATAACDGGCNLVSGSESSGINLGGDGGERLPAIATTIAGNHIGLDAAGSGSIANVGAGVLVGAAPQTVIGGSRAGDANRIAGGTAAVLAGPGAPDLVVRGNLVGLAAAAGASAPANGIVVDSEGLFTPAVEALILDNEVGLSGGTGIAQQGFGASIAGNLVFGAATGIRAHVLSEGPGNLIEGNLIEATTGAGILVENNGNQVIGNEIVGTGGAGIRILGEPPFGNGENVVGGDTAEAENVIEGSNGAAIEISNVEGTQNEVVRNRGSGNLGPFIDLLAADPDTEPDGPNGGILPPTIAAGETSAAGLANPGTVVRVFRKQTSSQGEIESFLGQTVTDAGGNWSLAFPAALPAGAFVAATQTNELGGTSELAIAGVVGPEPKGGSPDPPPVDPRGDRRPPHTEILQQSRELSRSRSVRFFFASNERGSRFQCSLDDGGFRGCKSPKRYRGLAPGKHVFRVRAIDRAGNVDPTPAKRRFRIHG